MPEPNDATPEDELIPDAQDFMDALHEQSGAIRQSQTNDESLKSSRPPQELQALFQRSLGDIPYTCPCCHGFCQEHSLLVRDKFLARAADLSRLLHDGTILYQMNRKFGVLESPELLDRIYDYWGELSTLFNFTEPEEVEIEETETEDEEDDKTDKP